MHERPVALKLMVCGSDQQDFILNPSACCDAFLAAPSSSLLMLLYILYFNKKWVDFSRFDSTSFQILSFHLGLRWSRTTWLIIRKVCRPPESCIFRWSEFCLIRDLFSVRNPGAVRFCMSFEEKSPQSCFQFHRPCLFSAPCDIQQTPSLAQCPFSWSPV